MWGEKDENDDDLGARTRGSSAEETCAHVDFFMPVHLQKQSQLDSEQLGITAQLFLCKCFHLCIPTLLPCLFFVFFQWIDMNNMIATCISHEREPTFGNLKM